MKTDNNIPKSSDKIYLYQKVYYRKISFKDKSKFIQGTDLITWSDSTEEAYDKAKEFGREFKFGTKIF